MIKNDIRTQMEVLCGMCQGGFTKMMITFVPFLENFSVVRAVLGLSIAQLHQIFGSRGIGFMGEMRAAVKFIHCNGRLTLPGGIVFRMFI